MAVAAPNGAVSAVAHAGPTDNALALPHSDAADAPPDESDSDHDEDHDKAATNGKGARGKKRAKSS